MDSPKNQLADKLRTANNVLVTVSRDPSVDQLAACIGLTLLLNKLGKHAAAVFSGNIPSTIEFLQPEETLEKNTDSLRDFIIALDKSKADKLRYKVEDNVVRIFITPYKTSISQADLEFSQGDFNVDVVVALGVQQQQDLDGAITAHGRILHDATVASINTATDAGLGSINWHDPQASSLSELVTELSQALGDDLLDSQIATALLTGIVASTDRFSNERTSSRTMNASAALMTAGANQQLVATKLEAPPTTPIAKAPPAEVSDEPDGDAQPEAKVPQPDDGTLNISHDDTPADKPKPKLEESGDEPSVPPPPPKPSEPFSNSFTPPPKPPVPAPDFHHDDEPPKPEVPITPPPPPPKPSSSQVPLVPPARSSFITDEHLAPGAQLMAGEPSMGGILTANTVPENQATVVDPLSSRKPMPDQLLGHSSSMSPLPATPANSGMSVPPPPPKPSQSFISGLTPPPPAWVSPSDTNAPPDGDQTLTDLERSVHSPHLATPSLDKVRDEVSRALGDPATDTPQPIEALNAQPLGPPLHMPEPFAPTAGPPDSAAATAPPVTADPTGPPAEPPMSAPMPPPVTDPSAATPAPPVVADPTAPPPVPPPIPFSFGAPGTPS